MANLNCTCTSTCTGTLHMSTHPTARPTMCAKASRAQRNRLFRIGLRAIAAIGPRNFCACLLVLSLLAQPANAGDGNRHAYLDDDSPWYPSRSFPKLITPQWVGEPGVDAVVILAIDDMRGHEKWEAYLRPILNRLKKIDGRAPVSIMTCQIDPKDPHLQVWLKEGLSLECHTLDHPCPILGKGDFAAAKA